MLSGLFFVLGPCEGCGKLIFGEGHDDLFVRCLLLGNAFDFVGLECVMANADGGSLIFFGKGFHNSHDTFERLGVFSPIDSDFFPRIMPHFNSHWCCWA